MKIVINVCGGGFDLSPQALLWLYGHGFDEPGSKTPIDEYFKQGDSGWKVKALTAWRQYLSDPPARPFPLWVFSPDERFVLNIRDQNRAHPLLVKCVETLKEGANGKYANLKIVEIPDGVKWQIEEDCGNEWVAEQHRTWD